MKQHKGMRPHDIVILLKIATLKNESWFAKNLATDLEISASEVSESLNRSKIAGLLTTDKKHLMTKNLLDFLEYGIKYVYPAIPGTIQRGMATAHSATPLNKLISSDRVYVWPWAEGLERGEGIEPLHVSVPNACIKDSALYELLTLVDALRIGRVREQKLAITVLKQSIHP